MAEFPVLPLFTDAFIGDTSHLNAAQTGAYLMLLMIAWRTPNCALPNDDEKLARWARMDRRTWGRNKSTVMSFWKLGDDDLWTQGRLSDERHRVEYVSSRNSANVKSRWLKNKETGHTNVIPLAYENDTKPLTLTISLEETEKEGGRIAHFAPILTPAIEGVNGHKKTPPPWDGDNDREIPSVARVPLAESWGMPDQLFEEFRTMGWSEERLLAEVGKMRAYWLHGKGSGTLRSVKGWRQTTINWLAKAAREVH